MGILQQSLDRSSGRSTDAVRPPREHGLDTLRATAIAIVFMYHYSSFVSHESTFGFLSVIGWTGVDLFFVLSGYLIANQLFSGVVRHRILSLKNFYARRALRTLPVYWLILALYFLLPDLMGGSTPPPLWRFLTFTQNWGLHGGTAFSHAWSLCIEEQFYLILPLAVAGGLWRVGCSRRGWAVLGILVLSGIGARACLWFSYGKDFSAYHTHIYYSTIGRFDEFLPGVAVAMLKNFHRPLWDRIMAHGQRLLFVACIAVTAVLYAEYRFEEGESLILTAFGYSAIAIAFALLVAAALSPGSYLHRSRVPGAYHLAVWSYSIYLSHKAIGNIALRVFSVSKPPGIAAPLIVAAVCIGVGAVLYRAIEVPFMAFRARRFPSTFERLPVDVGTIPLRSGS